MLNTMERAFEITLKALLVGCIAAEIIYHVFLTM